MTIAAKLPFAPDASKQKDVTLQWESGQSRHASTERASHPDFARTSMPR